MARILVASTNPVKASAVLEGFAQMFPEENFEIEMQEISSGVSPQPATDAETLIGAMNRAQGARKAQPGLQYYVGIEGGVEPTTEGGMRAFAWVIVLSNGRLGQARSGSFDLPPDIVALINEGVELGEADDRVFNRSDSKRKDGAIGILTGGVVDRQKLYAHAVMLALVPIRNPDLYPPINHS